MTENAILGGCFDGLFNINGIITQQFENLTNFHISNNVIITSVASNNNMNIVKRQLMDSALHQAEYNVASGGLYKFKKNRTGNGFDFVAGHGIEIWDPDSDFKHFGNVSKPVESFGSLVRPDGVITAGGPIGGTMFVYSIE
jgi:hypothetical protein